jgi:site-specific DNA-methyltransferase (adenine-specific)
MNTKVMFSSNTDEWETPKDLFNKLDQEFNFWLDVCATEENKKVGLYISKEQDGLKQKWSEYVIPTCWMNPPYGKEIGKWVKKAYEESLNGATVVCLLPARTDTKWFHEYILGKAEIRFLKGRLRFGDSKDSAPFPSMIVIFRGKE